MAKEPPKSGKPWTPADVKQLKQLAKGNTPTPLITCINKPNRNDPHERIQALALGKPC